MTESSSASSTGELHDLTVAGIAEALASGDVSSREVTQAFLARIDSVESEVRAFLTVTADVALGMADEADRRLAAGERGPLLGVPVGLKDLICTKGTRTTGGSRILDNYIPPYDATVVRRLREAGAVFLGKLNMDEFAMGSSCENSGYYPTHNPWDLTRIPGGSSGGSVAAVAARECPASLGSDTGGSIKLPAALCGVVGIRPTYGRVSRYGILAFASSLDQIGPVTRDVRDAAVMMNAICGHDPKDSTSAPNDVPDFTAAIGQDIKGVKIGIPKEYFLEGQEGMDPEVEAAVRKAADTLVGLGAELIDISLPHTQYGVATYYLVCTAEASSNLARYDGAHYGHRAAGASDIIDMFTRSRNEGFGAEVKLRIMLGTYVLSAGFYDAYYMKALKVRTLLKRDFEAAFEKVDLILTPTSPTPAFKLGEKADDPLQMYLTDIFTISPNLAGLGGMSVPCGFTSETNLPIGLQLIPPAFGEEAMLRVAHAYEQTQNWGDRAPKL